MSVATITIAELAELLKDREAAVSRLRNLVEWGQGENAPHLAERDWSEARDWLEAYDQRQGI